MQVYGSGVRERGVCVRVRQRRVEHLQNISRVVEDVFKNCRNDTQDSLILNCSFLLNMTPLRCS